MDYVFIVGVARTASETYQGIINNNSVVDIVNEMHYLTPSWLKKDFTRHFNKKSGANLTVDLVPQIVSTMYEGDLNGAFWAKQPNATTINYNINDINLERLTGCLAKYPPLKFKSILKEVLKEHAQSANKKVAGAKFPVNISCGPKLFQWFPEA